MSKLICALFLLITVALINAQYSNPSSAYLMSYPYGSYSGGGYNRYPSYSNNNNNMMMYSNGYQQRHHQQYPYGSYYSGYGRSYQYQYPSSSSYMSSYPSYAYAARSYQPSSPLASFSLFCANCGRG